jgi:CPA2 family monovalent cation:H+ antiporter-2
MPLALGFGLAQVGEFSFVLARTGLKENIISADFFSLILSVSVITMIFSPFMSMFAVPLYSLKRKWFKHEQIQTLNIPDGGLNNHIVIAGGGRVGFQIASIFKQIDFPFIIIEQDFRRFEKSKDAGFPIIYGVAGQETVLHASKISKARLIIITIPSISAAREIISEALKYNPDVKIIVRSDDMSNMDELYKMNIYEVVQPEFEASIEIIRQSLMILDVPLTKIINFTDEIRHQNYSDFKIDKIKNTISDNIKNTPFLLEMTWLEVLKNSGITGKSIKEMSIRSKTGVSVVGILRNNEFIPNPEPGFIFKTGDRIAIIGLPENKKIFNDMVM